MSVNTLRVDVAVVGHDVANLLLFSMFSGVGKTSIARSIARALNRQV